MKNFKLFVQKLESMDSKDEQEKIKECRKKIPNVFYKDYVTNERVPALYFVVIDAESTGDFTSIKGEDLFNTDKRHTLYNKAKKGLADAIEACRDMGENSEALKLLEQVVIQKSTKNALYNDFMAAYRKILIDAGFSQTAIEKTILPELKRIAKNTKPPL